MDMTPKILRTEPASREYVGFNAVVAIGVGVGFETDGKDPSRFVTVKDETQLIWIPSIVISTATL